MHEHFDALQESFDGWNLYPMAGGKKQQEIEGSKMPQSLLRNRAGENKEWHQLTIKKFTSCDAEGAAAVPAV